jgi:hypothetical protein
MNMTYTFVTAITDGRLAGEDYRDWTGRQLAEHGLQLTDGEIKRGDDLIGFYAFLDRDQGTPLVPAEARQALAELGPFGGTVVGYLNWTHAVDERAGQAQLAPAVLAIGRSIVARTDNGRYKQALRPVEFPLSNLVGNHGFADGEALISRDDDYLRYVQREAQAAIAAAGLSGDVGRFDTHHNPIRLVGDLRLHGRVVDEPERELAGHRFQIWALDLASLADWEFWSD